MATHICHRHKRGDTFDLSGSVSALVEGEPVPDFTNWVGASQIRDARGQLVAELEFEWLDPAERLVRIKAPATTDAWPIGPVRMDVQLTSPDEKVISTETVTIEIVEDITR
jgi:hypothetical protein